MFDIGFSEILVIAVVCLLVIGPSRLPETMRTLALWLGRLRRMASKLYQEVEHEVGMDDVRRQLHNEQILEQLKYQPDPKAEKPAEHVAGDADSTSRKETGADRNT